MATGKLEFLIPYITAYKSNYLGQNIILEEKGYGILPRLS